MQHVSREQLTATFRGLATQTVRELLASGELTPIAREVAQQELELREGEPQEPEEPRDQGLSPIEAAVAQRLRDFLREPFGWTWGMWLALLVPCVAVVAVFGTKARSQDNQWVLYVVILLQGATLSGILRALCAVFRFNSVFGVFGNIVAIGMLVFLLLALSLCSMFAQQGWGGG